MIPLFTVDAFTIGNNSPFTGNSAAVCLLEYDDDICDDIKQKIASEMNLSETAFVAKQWTKISEKSQYNTDKDLNEKYYTLRWFTPLKEVELCGHATLAAAYVLFENMKLVNENDNNLTKIAFGTKVKGILNAEINRKTNIISLNFPNDPPQELNKFDHQWIDAMVSATIGSNISLNEVQHICYGIGTKKLLIRLSDPKSVTECRVPKVSPHLDNMMQIDTKGLVKGVIVTEKANLKDARDNVHFYSRYFSPWNGINEDPVTGSAHTVLAPYWRYVYDNDGVFKDEELIGKQCYPSRGGFIHTLVLDNRVKLSGTACIIIKGQLKL